MPDTHIIQDVDLVQKAQKKLKNMGTDLNTVINDFLLKIISQDTEETTNNVQNNEIKLISFDDLPKEERERRLKIINSKGTFSDLKGIFEGMIWMADDFDEPLDCMKDYMP